MHTHKLAQVGILSKMVFKKKKKIYINPFLSLYVWYLVNILDLEGNGSSWCTFADKQSVKGEKSIQTTTEISRVI